MCYEFSMATENRQWNLLLLINLRNEAGPVILIRPLCIVQK